MNTHPLHTATAIANAEGMAVIGRTLADLRGHRFHSNPGGAPSAPVGPISGGASAPAPAAPANPDPAAAAAAAAAANPAAGVDPNAAAADVQDGDPKPDDLIGTTRFGDLPTETQAEVRRLRRNEQTLRAERTTLQQQIEQGLPAEQVQAIRKALGLEPDAQVPDAAALATRAEQAESRANTVARENLVLLEAPDAGANAKLLLDSRGFAATINGLDPEKDRAAIVEKIKTWVQANPTYAAAPVIPGSSGGVRQQGEPRTASTNPTLHGAVSAAMSGQRAG